MIATETKHYSVEQEGTQKVHWFRFDNWYDYIALAENGDTELDDSSRHSRGDVRSGSWDNGANFTDAIELARKGWKEGTTELHSRIKNFENIMPSRRFRQETVMDITGPGVLDFGRWAMGHPEAWMVQRENEVVDTKTGNIIQMVFNISASSGVKTSEMMNKGAAIVGLIDLLEQAGKRVELDLVAGIRGKRGTSIRTQVRVKDASSPVDIERLAFAMAHGASFRRVVFSLLEQAPLEARQACSVPGNYGIPEDFYLTDAADAVYIPTSSMEFFRSEASRVAWVTAELAARGVVLED